MTISSHIARTVQFLALSLLLIHPSAVFAQTPTLGSMPNNTGLSKATGVSSYLNSLDPIQSLDLTTIPGLINAIVPYVMILSGLILFIMLISGGFQLLLSGANPKQADAGKQRLTTAIIGFVIIITAYWLTQIVQIILGVNILK